MIHGDATAAALEAVLEELGAAEDRAARAGHALAELEELAEEDPAAAAGLDACRRRLAAAEEWLAEVRRRRRDLEVRLGEGEALRVRAGRSVTTA
jgi:benzoyl-CoA reductase/2-hydroxyglutaryl-CoA dehydratase subunit BcrC/BadD/HgdB